MLGGGAVKSLRKETGPMLVKKIRMKPPEEDQSRRGLGCINFGPFRGPIWAWFRLYLTLKESNLGVAQAIFDPQRVQSGCGSGYI